MHWGDLQNLIENNYTCELLKVQNIFLNWKSQFPVQMKNTGKIPQQKDKEKGPNQPEYSHFSKSQVKRIRQTVITKGRTGFSPLS